jgi:hypothetical protein
VRRDDRWGLDHGTWSVLLHVYPQANIPVVQLSIDETQPPSFHYEIGQRLAQLREEGILILGSGNLVHNLHAYAWGRHAPEPYDWAVSFESRVRELLLAGEYKPLVNYERHLGSEAELAVPTPDHYLPLLYVAGTRASSEPVTFPVEGVDGGSVSMLAVQGGLPRVAFLVNSTAHALDAIACEHLARCNTHVLEEPPWLFSESASPLSSALCTPRAPHGLSIQTVSQLLCRRMASWSLTLYRRCCQTIGYRLLTCLTLIG